MASSTRGGGPIDAIIGWLGSRVAIGIGAVVATIGTGGVIIQHPNVVLNEDKIQEIARPDPWYGEQGRENQRAIRENEHMVTVIDNELDTVRAVINGFRARIETIERNEVLLLDHIDKAEAGYDRIRECERRSEVSIADRRLMWEELRRLRERIYGRNER